MDVTTEAQRGNLQMQNLNPDNLDLEFMLFIMTLNFSQNLNRNGNSDFKNYPY